MRARISDRFTELHAQRQEAEAKLAAALEAALPTAARPAILDKIPYAGDVVLPDPPPALKTRLFAALDVTVLWNKLANQATVRVVISDATLQAIPGILNPGQDGYNPGQDGYHDTAATPADSPLTRPALPRPIAQSACAGCGAARNRNSPSGQPLRTSSSGRLVRRPGWPCRLVPVRCTSSRPGAACPRRRSGAGRTRPASRSIPCPGPG